MFTQWNTRDRLSWAYDGGSHVRPLGADIHARLSRRNEMNILKYRGCDYDDNTYVFRMFTEYARFGDIRSLINKYVRNRREPDTSSNWGVSNFS